MDKKDKTQSSDIDKWCSSIESDEGKLYGPCDSREEAIRLAEERRNDMEVLDSECEVGRCSFADPGAYLFECDVDRLIQSIDDGAAENNFRDPRGGAVFKWQGLRSRGYFIKGLRDLLKKHMRSDCFHMNWRSLEKVPLPPRDDD